MDLINKLRSNDSLTCCMSEEERSQHERSRDIDRDLDEHKRRYIATQKIVLLGAGESGKSTFLKQMQIIHSKGFKLEDKLFYRTQIYENIMKGMAGLINGKKELRLPWRGNCFFPDNLSESGGSNSSGNVVKGRSSISTSGEATLNHHQQPTDITIRMKNLLGQFTAIYKQLIEERERESDRLQKRISIGPDDFVANNLVDLLLKLWCDEAIREAYDRRREVPKYFVENVPYFIENIERIGRKVNHKYTHLFLVIYNYKSERNKRKVYCINYQSSFVSFCFI
jgi:hypothetical protein